MQSGSRVSEGRGSTRLRSVFVVAQVTFSLVLLITAGLLISDLRELTRIDMGFDPEGLFTCGLSISPVDYPTAESRHHFFDGLLDQIEALPGVASVAVANKAPALHPYQDWGLHATSRPPATPADGITALARWASPGYFSTIGMPLLRGRDFEPTDRGDGAQVVILSEATARILFPDSDPIGQLVSIEFIDGYEFRVIGIAGDGRLNGIMSDSFRAFYLPSALFGSTGLQLIVRTTGDPLRIAGPVREVIRRTDPMVPMEYPTTIADGLEEQLGGFRVAISAMSLFAVLALALTAIGLYGVLSYHVRRRTSEFGLRVCLGATGGRIIAAVLRHALLLIGIGLALGIGGGLLSVPLLERYLTGAGPVTIAMWTGPLLVFLLVAFAACLMPALRVLRIDPVEALRIE
jgi:predicted permease